jgi:hypothetical protein
MHFVTPNAPAHQNNNLHEERDFHEERDLQPYLSIGSICTKEDARDESHSFLYLNDENTNFYIIYCLLEFNHYKYSVFSKFKSDIATCYSTVFSCYWMKVDKKKFQS